MASACVGYYQASVPDLFHHTLCDDRHIQTSILAQIQAVPLVSRDLYPWRVQANKQT